jgi:hypothetical protein
MDRTESTVRKTLTAIEAPLYDIGVLSDRGMLPGLDSIPAAAILDRLSLLKRSNARGSHIYIRPSGEHRFTTLDDLNETSLARLSADGFEQEITKLHEAREQEREARRLESSLSPQRGRRLSNISLERFRTSIKYQDRPAAGDIAFCVAAYANGMSQDRIERAPRRRLPLPRSQLFQASCLHPENHGEGEEMGRAIASLLRFALSIFLPASG